MSASECGSCGSMVDPEIALPGEPFHALNDDCRAVRPFSMVWVVNLGDGTFVQLDNKPSVMQVEQGELDSWIEAPTNCQRFDHIHLKDLVEQSHWNDDADPTHRKVTA